MQKKDCALATPRVRSLSPKSAHSQFCTTSHALSKIKAVIALFKREKHFLLIISQPHY